MKEETVRKIRPIGPLIIFVTGLAIIGAALMLQFSNRATSEQIAQQQPTSVPTELTETPPPAATQPVLQQAATPTPLPTVTNTVMPPTKIPTTAPTETPTEIRPTHTHTPPPTELPPTQPAATPTETPRPTNTATRIPPTATPQPSATFTPVPPTATVAPTNTPPPTWTPNPTNTPAPTATPLPTSTPQPTWTPTQTATPPPTWTPVPTNTPVPTWTPVPPATATPVPVPTSVPAVSAESSQFDFSYRKRFGISGARGQINLANSAGLPYGSFISWDIFNNKRTASDVSEWQMIRLRQSGVVQSYAQIEAAIAAQPGSIWVIGNEPDVVHQDNLTPARYAELYHDLYTFIKGKDSTALVAVGGVAAPTPLRMLYLEIMLKTYRDSYGAPLPTDIWTLHAYVLREERDSWGIGIPTGLGGVNEGLLFEIDDHAKFDIVNQQIADFRWWLKNQGYDVPLAITEFGILLPSDYGFPPDVVASYMKGSIDYYLNATSPSGYSGDGNRLVQWWFWFSIRDGNEYIVSDMIDGSGQMNEIGRTFAGYMR